MGGKAIPGDRTVWAHETTSRIRMRARKLNLACDLSTPLLLSIAPEYCPMTGVAIDYTRGNGRNNLTDQSPAVIRLVPSGDWTAENLLVVSNRATQPAASLEPFELRVLADELDLRTKGNPVEKLILSFIVYSHRFHALTAELRLRS